MRRLEMQSSVCYKLRPPAGRPKGVLIVIADFTVYQPPPPPPPDEPPPEDPPPPKKPPYPLSPNWFLTQSKNVLLYIKAFKQVIF